MDESPSIQFSEATSGVLKVSAHSFLWAHPSLCHTRKAQREDSTVPTAGAERRRKSQGLEKVPREKPVILTVVLMLREIKGCPPDLGQ